MSEVFVKNLYNFSISCFTGLILMLQLYLSVIKIVIKHLKVKLTEIMNGNLSIVIITTY